MQISAKIHNRHPNYIICRDEAIKERGNRLVELKKASMQTELTVVLGIMATSTNKS
jgi:hypothetical protein